MNRQVLLIPAIAIFLASCGDDARAPQTGGAQPVPAADTGAKLVPGSFHEGGGFTAFYGEEVFDKRIYLFGQQSAFEKFSATHEIDITKAKTYIGEGPNHETVIVQTDKEAPQMADRVYQQFKKRYSIN